MSQNVIEFKNVGLQFGSGLGLFKNLNVSIPKGSFSFLTGLSGSGKSTFLRMLYLDLFQTTGDIRLFGKSNHDITKNALALYRRKVGVVFQDFRLINHLSALENVALPLKAQGVDTKRRLAQAYELLDWVGLKDFVDSKPSVLSGGQQQRVAIARAVVMRPHLLLADEPTGNVDDKVAIRLLYLFEELNKTGTTILVATHNQHLISTFPYPQLNLEEGTLRKIDSKISAPKEYYGEYSL